MIILKTIIVSDIHLGNPYSNWKLLDEFLKNNKCENLFLNGDIIDEHYLIQNNKQLNKEELEFLYKITNSKNSKYIIGNHEVFNHIIHSDGEFWDKYNVKVYDYFLYHPGVPYSWSRYYISHGHKTIFRNPITSNQRILNLIDCFIRFVAKIQKIHKGIIFQKGKLDVTEGVEFEILSNDSRKFFKTALKIVSGFKKKAKEYHMAYHADGIICGHIHHPEIKYFKSKYIFTGKFPYLNSGDWLENNSVLVQDIEGNWEIIKMN